MDDSQRPLTEPEKENKAIHVVIFAKAPLPGFAKTRLIPALGKDGSARLAAQLLIHTVEQALEANIGVVELCVTPSKRHPIWDKFAFSKPIVLTEQGEGDLGARMDRATKRVVGKGGSILLMGTDCPALKVAMLRKAADALLDHTACMVPVHDGGYALLGLNKYLSNVFSSIPWSTAEVAALTRQRIRAQGGKLQELKTLNDIDEPKDLCHLPWRFLTGDGE